MSVQFADEILLKNGGGEAKGSVALAGKVVGLYFSAHWCPPCCRFTPILKEFHAKNADKFEVVFVSSDETKEEQENYLKEAHGNWYYMPFDEDKINAVGEKYGIDAIPSLVIVKPDGTAIDCNGVEGVQETPDAVMEKWIKESQ